MRRQKNFGSSFAVNIRNISNKKPLLSSGFLFIAFENIQSKYLTDNVMKELISSLKDENGRVINYLATFNSGF